MRYQWLIFDADHTLFDFDRAAKSALLNTLESLGLPTGEHIYPVYQRINKPLWKALEAGALSAQELKWRRTEELLTYLRQTYGADLPDDNSPQWTTLIRNFLQRYLESLATGVWLMPGVKETLAQLAGSCQMIILTNGIHDMQIRRLQNSGIAPCFRGLISSDRFGQAKPDPAIFEHALEKLDAPPKEQVLMVGDQLETDILGARRCGLDSCWYNPRQKHKPPSIAPDYEIHHFSQLLTVVQDGLS